MKARILAAAAFTLLPMASRANDAAAQPAVTPPGAAPPSTKSAINPSPESAERIKWWREARFGMFIHFGLYSIPGKGEWYMWEGQVPVEEYSKYADQFHPLANAAENWVKVAESAGAKYVVLTAKHHDGFALFDSAAADGFNSWKTAAHRDLIAEYTQAMHRAGLRVGIYYSPLDWRYPGYFLPDIYRGSAEAMRAKYHQQMKELLSNYGKIDLIWYDGGSENWLGFRGLEWGPDGWHTRDKSKPYSGSFSWQDKELTAELRKIQPNFVMDDRTDALADYQTREGDAALGKFDNQTPWELATTLTGFWGYKPNMPPMTLDHAVTLLANVAGRDGNLLLNVGPRADGTIEPADAARMAEIGGWLKANGASIYGTRGGPYLPLGQSIVSTRKGDTIFLHILKWPDGTDKLTLPNPDAKIVGVDLLSGRRVDWQQQGPHLILTVPAKDRDNMDTIVRIKVQGSAMSLPLKTLG